VKNVILFLCLFQNYRKGHNGNLRYSAFATPLFRYFFFSCSQLYFQRDINACRKALSLRSSLFHFGADKQKRMIFVPLMFCRHFYWQRRSGLRTDFILQLKKIVSDRPGARVVGCKVKRGCSFACGYPQRVGTFSAFLS